MDLSDLHIFRSVVEAGGVTRAAEKLNRVQSNVTTRVRQLESELGVDLFVREGKRLHVSPAGKLFLAFPQRAIPIAAEAGQGGGGGQPRRGLRCLNRVGTARMRL